MAPPCTCFFTWCQCPAKLWLDILCVLGAPPSAKLPFIPNLNLKLQRFEFTYCNDRFPTTAITCKLVKYALLQPLLTQPSSTLLPPIIITIGIRGTFHTNTIQCLKDLHITSHNICKLMEPLSQIPITYLMHIILNKQKL